MGKYKKDCKIPKIILVQGFCPLKSDIIGVAIDFRLKTLTFWPSESGDEGSCWVEGL